MRNDAVLHAIGIGRFMVQIDAPEERQHQGENEKDAEEGCETTHGALWTQWMCRS